MKKRLIFILIMAAVIILASYTAIQHEKKDGSHARTGADLTGDNAPVGGAEKKQNSLTIADRPVLLTEHRRKLTREYSEMHYGEPMETIIPRAIVIHWTASGSLEGVYNYLYGEEAERDREYGRLNLTSHFLVDRDGAIYRLTPETMLNRHAIGLNWCSIGVENVGGVGGEEDLTEAQLKANAALAAYLKEKYPSINYLMGHYQQDHARKAGLWRENVPGYYTGKPDPGPIFMKKLIESTSELGLTTFDP